MELETLKTVGKVILGIIGVLLFILPVRIVNKLVRRIRDLF